MAFIQMKCPNCGGQMVVQNGGMSYKCPHCGTTVLNIVDAKLDSDVTIMSAEEYEKKINENKKSFIVKIDEKLEEIDVDTIVINKKIKQAKELLNQGKWFDVFGTFSDYLANSLKAKWEYLPSVNRLLLLAYYQVKDESELLLRSVFLDTVYMEDTSGSNWTRVFGNIFAKIVNSPLCDQQTKDSYLLIEQECKKNCDIDKEISEGYKLLQVGETQKFTAYAKKMCNKYPFKIKSWLMLAEAYNNDKKRLEEIYEIIKRCPDFNLCQECVVAECKRYGGPGYNNTNNINFDNHKGVSFRVTYKLKDIIYNNDKRIIEEHGKENKKRKKDTRRYIMCLLLRTVFVLAALCFALWMFPRAYCGKFDYNETVLQVVKIILISSIAILGVSTLVMIIKQPDRISSFYSYYYVLTLIMIAIVVATFFTYLFA